MPPQVLPIADLRNALSSTYSSRVTPGDSRRLRKENVDAFFAIDRDGLQYASLEHRVQLYSTLSGEKIFIQFPGKESINATPMPLDFRPKLMCLNGEMMQDATFGFIWDILDDISRSHNDSLALVATMFFRMGYMYDYLKTNGSYPCSALKIDGDNVTAIDLPDVPLSWFCIDLSDDIWFSLNNYVGEIRISENQVISFEAFIKFIDLLVQNEDCKYYYRNVILEGSTDYKLNNGRTSTCDANLLIINYLRRRSKISDLLNSFQKARGVPPFKKGDYPTVTDGIVTRI
jgi:hypothetical protein